MFSFPPQGMPYQRAYEWRVRNAPAQSSGIACDGCASPGFGFFWDQEGALPVLVISTGQVLASASVTVTFRAA